MNTKKTTRLGLAILLLAPALCAPVLQHSRSALMAQDGEPAPGEAVKTDAAGARAMGKLVQALQIEDEAARVRACLPLLHRSLLSADGTDIDPSVKKVAWKKAAANASGLELPIKVVRVRSKGNLTIGEGSKRVEQGRVDDYFLARSDKELLPARVTLFFPKDGEPKIYDLSGI